MLPDCSGVPPPSWHQLTAPSCLLSSSNRQRMHFAIRQLIEEPQNNLKIFKVRQPMASPQSEAGGWSLLGGGGGDSAQQELVGAPGAGSSSRRSLAPAGTISASRDQLLWDAEQHINTRGRRNTDNQTEEKRRAASLNTRLLLLVEPWNCLEQKLTATMLSS